VLFCVFSLEIKRLEAIGHRQTENLALIKYDSILKQQTADMLTDWFRAHILRAFGYKVEIVEFVQSKHTGKNLLIRAHKRPDGFVDPAIIEEYVLMKEKWAVTPHLETLLRKNNCWWE